MDTDSLDHYLLWMASKLAHFGGWSADLCTQKISWSDEVAHLHDRPSGYSPDIEEGISYYAPEWQDTIRCLFTACVSDGESYDEELEIISARGVRRWVRTTAEAVRDSQGQIIRVQGAFQDITERKLAQIALYNSESQYRLVVENSRDMVVLHDLAGCVLYINPAGLESIGYTATDVLGQHFLKFVPPAYHAAAQARAAQRKQLDDQTLYYEAQLLHREGHLLDYEFCSALIKYQHRPPAILLLGRDISERKQKEQELQQKTRMLKQIAWSQSHELRRPVANILGLIELIQEADAEQARYLDLLAEAAHEIDSLIHRMVAQIER